MPPARATAVTSTPASRRRKARAAATPGGRRLLCVPGRRDIPEHFIPGATPDAFAGSPSTQGRNEASGVAPGIKWNELNRSADPVTETGCPQRLWAFDALRLVPRTRGEGCRRAFAAVAPAAGAPPPTVANRPAGRATLLDRSQRRPGRTGSTPSQRRLPRAPMLRRPAPRAYEELAPGGAPHVTSSRGSLGRRSTRTILPCPHWGQRVTSWPVSRSSSAVAVGGTATAGASA